MDWPPTLLPVAAQSTDFLFFFSLRRGLFPVSPPCSLPWTTSMPSAARVLFFFPFFPQKKDRRGFPVLIFFPPVRGNLGGLLYLAVEGRLPPPLQFRDADRRGAPHLPPHPFLGEVLFPSVRV